MDNNLNNNAPILNMDAPKPQSNYIKVIGVGGCGTNIANYLFKMDSDKVDFIVCDTNARHLANSPIPVKIQLGDSGLGAGLDPDVARKAAENQKEEIKQAIGNNVRLLFITAGLGKGTGTGAAPVIAKIAKEMEQEIGEDILVIAIVTTPLKDEGIKYIERANEGLAALRDIVNTSMPIDNNKLDEYNDDDIDEDEAYEKVDNVLVTWVKCIYDMMTSDARQNTDFNDIKRVLKKARNAQVGVGYGSGEDRARQALAEAISSEFINDLDYKEAKNVLVSISSSQEAKLKRSESRYILDYVTNTLTSSEETIPSKNTNDSTLGDKLKVAIIIAGFSDEKLNTKNININKTEPLSPIIPSEIHTMSLPPLPVKSANEITDPDTLFVPEEKLQEKLNSYDTINENTKPLYSDMETVSFEKEAYNVTSQMEIADIGLKENINTNLQDENFNEIVIASPNLSSLDEESKEAYTAKIAERIAKIRDIFNDPQKMKEYERKSPDELKAYLGEDDLSDKNNMVNVSEKSTIANCNAKGEKDINTTAFLHDIPD
ncbi:MAG: cell division FtsZ family protein [Bacteroidales bacterium]|jgi:cell division protein FtsZ|nr:cell division FtsZ family protein [Bacteroidales bacterium]